MGSWRRSQIERTAVGHSLAGRSPTGPPPHFQLAPFTSRRLNL